MSEETTTKKSGNMSPTVAITVYVTVAVGLIIIFAVTAFILRKIRVNRAKKYIKTQSKLSVPMGPVLTSKPPTRPWKWKEVKANIKARHRGEERPYGSKPTVSVISNGDSNGVSRPQSANSSDVYNRPQSANRPKSARPTSATSLGPSKKSMYGENGSQIARHVKHERLRKRIEAKHERKEMKERQKAIKRDLTLMLEETLNGTSTEKGQRLPGDEFPESGGHNSSAAVTHVGPLRRESLMEIPNLTYLIEQSRRDKLVHRSTGAKNLNLPQNLVTWDEERDSPRGKGKRAAKRIESEVTVHRVIDPGYDDADVESLGDHNTTEL